MNKITFKIVASGLLIALSVVLTRIFSADLVIAGVPAARLAIGYVPIIIASIILGPYFGMTVGAAADIIGFFLFPKGVYFPPITITSALVGLLPYLIVRLSGKLPYWLKILLAVAVTQITCSMFLQTIWLSLLYTAPFEALFYPRAVVVLITIPIYYILVYSIIIGLKKAKLFNV